MYGHNIESIKELKGVIEQEPFNLEKADALINKIDFELEPLELEKILLDNIKSEDVEIRIFAYEYLYNFKSEDVFQAALKGISDEEELVRINAVEILGNLPRKESLPYLEKVLNAKEALLRCYAAETIGIIGGKNAKSLLEERLKYEEDSFARLGIYSSLYMLGEKQMLKNVIALLDDSNYLTVIRSLEYLSGIADESNRDYISMNIEKLIQHTNPYSVKEKAENVLEELKKG
ncbi:HEAT repeat domain-containing protein [Listeria booriae]|uniref:HEAT repeat domain-containing protein n=1 Tax=Listeria booriae TaxID=1552123 RepID=UPI0016247F82|nr:HEAT repeat domain-containing protein [Listeria booriae]MBC2328113.1 HEAT repeat domain-containing protein [Listeria booriae]